MKNCVRVLLAESQREIVSLLTLSLSDIKECELEVCAEPNELLMCVRQAETGLVVLNAGSDLQKATDTIKQIHEVDRNVYVIVSLPERFQETTDLLMKAGAHDYVLKDRNYVPNIVGAVKRALIRIAEREAFDVPVLARAQQLAMDENLPDIILSLDLDGLILHSNHAISTLLGYPQKEIVGVCFTSLIAEEAGREKFNAFLEAVDQHISFREMLLLNNHKSQPIPFDLNFTLMEGEIIYGVARKQVDQPVEWSESPDERIEPLPRQDPPDKQFPEHMPSRIGAYRIITLLGAGAMGRVYKAFDEQLERYVAIKVISKSLAENETYLERFKREAIILASISHPNIALIYYFGTLEGLPYFCMEYLANGSVESMLQTVSTIDPQLAVSYIVQAAFALREALSKGVLHMDVKPSNLMLAEDGRLKIVDFGLAHTQRHMADLQKTIVGTPLYIAPEQIIGGVADFRMDIYSLGITFFEMLYGFVPFGGDSVPDIFQKKLKGVIPLRTELNSAVPARLYEVVKRMIARDSMQRISNYSELIEELEGARRSSGAESVGPIEKPDTSVVVMRGLIYDQPIPEILGRIAQQAMTGRLTISLGQLVKQLHFREGKLIAVLSNQEGEDFIDLVISRLPAEARIMRKLQTSQSLDLYEDYSTVIEKISPEARLRLSQDLRSHAEKILENLFPWMMGEFIFEHGVFPDQLQLDLDIHETLMCGIRDWLNYDVVRRRLFDCKCILRHDPDFIRYLRNLNLQPSDRFLLFRFENEISYSELYALSGIPEEEFGRLIYVFFCFGLMHISDSAKVQPAIQKPQLKMEVPQTDLATYYTHCAVKSFEDKNYWACIEYCRKALDHRQDANVYRLMGRALAMHTRFRNDALHAFEKALALSPNDAGIGRDIADLYFRSANFLAAKTRYEAILRQNPSDQHATKRLQEINKMKR